MVMDRKEAEKSFTHFQARARGYLLRTEVKHARADFEDIVTEVDGGLSHLQWRDALLAVPRFTDTDPLPRNTSSKSAPTPKLHCLETHIPEQPSDKTEGKPHPQQLTEKTEAERDGLHVQKQPPLPRECSPGIPAGGPDRRQADTSHSHHDRRGSTGDSSTSAMWRSEELDTGIPPTQRGPLQHHLAQGVPLTQEDLRLHRNTLSMELLWLQQAITSRKKYLSLKQRLSAT